MSLARRYHCSHFTGEEIEAPQERDTGWATDILNLDPKPQPFRPLAWVSLCVCGLSRASRCGGQAWGLPKFCHHFWTGHTGSWERAPWSPSLSGSLEDSEVQSEQGCKWVVQRWVPEGWRAGWGVSRCIPQGGRPASCFPFPASHHPPPHPAPPSTVLRGVSFEEGEPDTGALAEDVFLPSGQNISGAFRRGLNTLSTLAAFGIPGRTQVCFHMQQDYNCTASLPAPLPPASSDPHLSSPPLSLVACSAPEQTLEKSFQVASGSEHLDHVTLATGLLGGERG